MTTPAPAAPGPAPRALVVEDDGDLSELLRTHLARLGWQVRVCPTGEDALEQAFGSPPDLVLLDLGLPGIDGATVLQRLRENESTSGCTVIVTTIMDSADLAGQHFDGLLPKPFTRRDVTRVLAPLTAGSSS